jgi:predicted nucleotidyltransferase
MDTELRVHLPMDEIASFCQRWKVTELALFGSVLRDDFGPDSDIDVLVTFAPDAAWTLMDMVEASDQLETVFGRPVDLVSRRAVEGSTNWIRRGEIISNAEPIYRAR